MGIKRGFVLTLVVMAWISVNVNGLSKEPGARVDLVSKSQPSQWPATPPFIRVGISEKDPVWAWVEAPAQVVDAASVNLKSQPTDWHVTNILNFHEDWPAEKDHRKDHIVIFTLGANSFTCLATPTVWTRLNEPSAFPVINEILDETAISVADLKILGKLTTYLEEVATLYRGSSRLVLYKKFYNLKSSDTGGWIKGKAKSFEAFRSLMYDPIVTMSGDKFKITCNFICMDGAVETWTFTGHFKPSANIAGISISRIRPPGTFSWPLVD